MTENKSFRSDLHLKSMQTHRHHLQLFTRLSSTEEEGTNMLSVLFLSTQILRLLSSDQLGSDVINFVGVRISY